MSRYCVLSCQKHLYECRDWNNEPTTDFLQSSIWPLGEDNTKKYKTRGIPWRRYRVSYVSCFYHWNIKTKQLQDNRSAETSVLWYCDIGMVLLPVRHKMTWQFVYRDIRISYKTVAIPWHRDIPIVFLPMKHVFLHVASWILLCARRSKCPRSFVYLIRAVT